MAKATLEPPNPPDVPVPSGEEAPPQPSFDDSFGAALDHALAPPKTSPAFDTAFDAAVDHVRSQVAWNPVEAFKSVYEGARGGTASIYEGLANTAAYLFDPSLKYANRSHEDLQSGINAAQARYDELAKEEYPEGASEYDVSRKQVQLSELRSNIEAQKHALARQVEPEYQPSLPENIAGGLRASAQESATIQAQERGEIPLPDKGLVNRLLDQPFVVRPNPVYQSTIPGAVASNVGGMIPYALGAMAAAPTGPVGEFAVESALFGGSSAQGGIEEAKAAGKDEEVQAAAAQWGMASGPVQAAAFRFLNLAPWLRGQGSRTVGEYVKSVAKNAAIGAAGGEAQRVYDNIVAQATGIDPNRKMTEGLGQNLLTNAIGMALFTGGIEAPSLAMRSLGRAGNLSVYQGKPGPESGAPEVGAPPTEPTEPGTAAPSAAPATEEAGAAHRQGLVNEAELALGRQDVGPAAVPAEPTATAPATEPEEPITKRDIRSVLSNLVNTVGPRANFLLADARSLPMRYRSALAEQGQTPNNFKAFFDRDTGDFVVNHQNIANEAELHDAIIRNFIPETFRDKATIVPISSWHDEAAGDAGVASMVSENANANTSVGGLYSTASGQVYLNVPKLLEAPDPMREALKTAVHEISVHQGIRTWFDDPHYMASFLNRVYNGMEQSGMGNHVAGAFGTDVEGLARQYGYGKENPDGSWQMDAIDRAKVGEELLARYAERFDPNELDKAPGVIQKAIDYVRTGMRRFQGLDFDRTDAFHFIRDAWRATDPQRDPLADTAALARRIGKSYVSPELESKRAIAADTRELNHAQQGVSPTGRGTEPERGRGNEDREIIQSSNRLGAYAQAAGRVIADGELSRHTSGQLAKPLAEEHDILIPRGADRSKYLIKLTKLGGFGPYGQHVEPLGAQPGGDPKTLAAHAIAGKFIPGPATADQYLERLRLSNVLFDSRYNLEGFQHDPSTALWQVVTSQPRYNNARPADTTEIVHYMEQRGFKPVDDRTFYDPSRKVLVADAHSGNVLVDKDTGRVIPIDVAPQHVEGKMAKDLEKIVNDPNRQAAIGKQLDDVHRMLLAQGIDLKSEGGLEQAQYAADQQLSEEAEQHELQQRAAQGVLNTEERARLDELEFGAFMKKDVEEELGPNSDPNQPPQKVRQVAHETQLAANPNLHIVRTSAERNVNDITLPESLRMFNASLDQLMLEKATIKDLEKEVDKIYNVYQGSVPEIANALISNQYDRGVNARAISARVTKRVMDDYKGLRQAALERNDQPRVTAVEAAMNRLSSWENERRSSWGREGAAWQDRWFTGESVTQNIRSKYFRKVFDWIHKNNITDFDQWVDSINKVAKDLTAGAVNDEGVQRIVSAAQRAHDRSMPTRIADALTGEITRALGPNSPPDLLRAFENSVRAKLKEQLPILDKDTVQKLSASDRVLQSVRLWPEFEQVFQKAAEELRGKNPDMDLFLHGLENKLDVPFTDQRLAQVVREQGVSIEQLFRQHRSNVGASVDTLSDFLTKNSNLTPEQAELVRRTVESHITSAVNERTEKEFNRILDQAAQRSGKTTAVGRSQSMQRLKNLVNMGAFDRDEVANALAPFYGYKGFTPEMGQELRRVNDTLERMRQQGRDGFQTEAQRQEFLRTISRYSEFHPQMREYWMGIFTGNLISGVPTHVIALMNELLQGFTNLATQVPWTRPGQVIPATIDSLGALVKGFGNSMGHAGYIWRTGGDPALFRTQADVASDASKIYRPGIFETKPTQRALEANAITRPFSGLGKLIDVPYEKVFRSVSLLHNAIYSGFGRSAEMLAAQRYAQENRGLTFEQARDWSHNVIYGTAGDLRAFREQAAAEGLSGTEAKMRVQELIDQQAPDEVLHAGDRWGTRANMMQDPEGALGMLASAFNRIAGQYPGMKQFAPFTRIPVNLVNETINMTPLGLMRWFDAKSMNRGATDYFTRGGQIKLSPEEIEELRGNLLGRIVMGSSALTALGLLAGSGAIQIHGAGPSDPKKKYQLMDGGWQPYSFQIGNTYLPYEYLPIYGGVAMLGNFFDGLRYEGPNPIDALAFTANRAPAALLDRSFLKGIADLLDTLTNAKLTEKERLAGLKTQFAAQKNFIPLVGSNFVKQAYQQFLDKKLYQSPNFGAALARDIPFAAGAVGSKPMLNFFGEPIHMEPYAHRFGSFQTADPVWNFLHEADLSLTKPSAQATLNGQKMTEDQFYDYTGFRGRALHELLAQHLPGLSSLPRDSDDEQTALEKRVKKLEHLADKQAKRSMLAGEKFVP